MFIRAWCYIRSLGGAGLKEASEQAIDQRQLPPEEARTAR
jgi:glycine cleavage system protein P-like pyridoxal-binding family